ncbi:hypothetical protein N7450_004858 [Penicillium hetheringtonii]|uniref:Uncharacterized protein n=1 Tax=Penicillium hetheringtonii TaxID=911720 RepID=A0AAD6DR39_9EURO|nr:hypothetical protein N7450_004858 [Penicillium hetheringtonii]
MSTLVEPIDRSSWRWCPPGWSRPPLTFGYTPRDRSNRHDGTHDSVVWGSEVQSMREPEVFHAVPLASDVSLAAEQVPVILLFLPGLRFACYLD